MPILGASVRPATHRAILAVCIGALTAAAWLALAASERFSHGLFHQHAGSGHTPPMPLFLAGWAVMTVAMMLPTSLPLLATFHAIAEGRRDSGLLVALAVAGYIVCWTLFGVAAYGAVVGIDRAAGSAAGVEKFVTPGLLLVAGGFQFSALKYRCLDKCRSPLSFVMQRWQGSRHHWQAFRLGWDHGVFCVGCCWALMLLMFAVGAGSLVWMLTLAVVMAVEKNVPWGRRMSAPLGVALVAWGLGLLVMP